MPVRNSSEAFIYNLCANSFFSLWCYPNPLREDGKELCDILVKFGGDLIIFSVKDITFNENAADYHIAAERWSKRAVEESINQILGAERHLANKGSFKVKATPGGESFEIKDIDKLRIHRVSISLGSGGSVPISSGRQEGKFIHVLTDEGFQILFEELDTIADFVQYLAARKDFLLNCCRSIIFHSEGDLLMLYINGNRQFPDYSDKTAVYLQDAGYEEFIKSSEYRAKKNADQPSYIVDEIINEFIKHYNAGTLVLKSSLGNFEMALAELASENRFARRGVGSSIIAIGTSSPSPGRYAARLYSGSTEKAYVIVAVPHNLTREQRYNILLARCHVGLGLLRNKLDRLLAIGIATELHDETGMHSYDLLYYFKEKWSDDDQREMERLQRDGKICSGVNWVQVQEDEYPVAGS